MTAKEIHDFTPFIHGLHGYKRIIAERGLKINKDEGRPFCNGDFPDIKGPSYRKAIQHLKPYLQFEYRSTSNFWKFSGVKITGDSHRITYRDMGVGDDFYNLLEHHKHEQPMIHDIKLKIKAIGVHDALAKKGCSVAKENKRIQFGFPCSDNNFKTKVSIYPSTIQLDISNTYKPLVFDIQSLMFLHEQLSQFSYHVFYMSDVSLPPVSEWIFTHYHIHTDSSHEYCGERFEVKVNDVVNGMIRFYSKQMGRGKSYTRLEQIQTPKTTIIEEMQKVVKFDDRIEDLLRNYHG